MVHEQAILASSLAMSELTRNVVPPPDIVNQNLHFEQDRSELNKHMFCFSEKKESEISSESHNLSCLSLSRTEISDPFGE